MSDRIHISDSQEFFGGMSREGLAIVTQLIFIKPGETIVYHVGSLPRDRSDPSYSYRTSDIAAKELDNIVWLAEAVAQKGDCRLVETPICDGVAVYSAVGNER